MLSWMISTRGEQGEIHPWKVSRDVEVVTPKQAHTMKAIFKPEDDKRETRKLKKKKILRNSTYVKRANW